MIYSMTAYARVEDKSDWGSVSVELRSVNQRYLETYFRLPENLRSLEGNLRELLRNELQRGKVECNIRYDLGEQQSANLTLNQNLLDQLAQHALNLQQQTGGQLNVVDLLRWPGVMNTPEADMDVVGQQLLASAQQAVIQLKQARANEGERLAALIIERLDGIESQVAFVRERMPQLLEWQRNKLRDKVADAAVDIDNHRLEQELVLMAQRIDVAEELDRLNSHIRETRNILKKGGSVGRRLDFMMQEFNREANTLGSKSIDTEITAAAVELKVLIEQMREQIQNIE